jgi:predicted phosphodiesterase
LNQLQKKKRPEILFFGDPHGDFAPIFAAVECFSPEAIVLLGDLQPRRPLHIELAPIMERTEIWFIHGNHDTDSDEDFDHLFGSKLAARNLHGRVEVIAGYRVAGLGGVFRQKIWDPAQPGARAAFSSQEALLAHSRRGKSTALDGWRGGFSRKHHSSIFPSDVDALSMLRSDILVTHEAPTCHSRGFQVLDDLALSLGAELVVHGHHHESIDYSCGGAIKLSSPFRVFGVDKGCFLAWPSANAREGLNKSTFLA